MRVDLFALCAEHGFDLGEVFSALDQVYRDIDARNERNTAGLSLPCHAGCDACCKESVFLTPLEFLGAWDLLQRSISDAQLEGIVAAFLTLYERNRDLIVGLSRPPAAGESDHLRLALQLRYLCPLLDAAGACRIYARRELYGRLFGCSFNDDSGIYGCPLVGKHLAGQVVTLLSVRRTAKAFNDLPLTHKRQVYPYYVHALYGKNGRPAELFG